LWVEEKYRKLTRSRDICLEVWSAEESRTPGWIWKPGQTWDYFTYAVWEGEWQPGARPDHCYLIDGPALRQMYRDHADEWTGPGGYRLLPTRNRGYTTVNIYVPLDVISASVTVREINAPQSRKAAPGLHGGWSAPYPGGAEWPPFPLEWKNMSEAAREPWIEWVAVTRGDVMGHG